MTEELQQIKPDYSLAEVSDMKYNRFLQMSEILSRGGSIVPHEIAQSQADCMAIVIQSDVWGMNPFQVVQKCHVIKGKIGYEAQLINTVGHKFAPLKERLRDRYVGDWSKIEHKSEMVQSEKSAGKYAVRQWNNADENGLGIVISGTFRGELEPRELKVMLSSCAIRNSTLWVTMPQQQIFYYATKMWFRKYYPEAIMGMYSPDEIQTIDVTPIVTTVEEAPLDELADDTTMAKLEELYNDASDNHKGQVDGKRNDDDVLTQGDAEKAIAFLAGRAKDKPQNTPERTSQERPSMSDATRDMLAGLLDDNCLQDGDRVRINEVLDDILSFEDSALNLANEILDKIDTEKEEK